MGQVTEAARPSLVLLNGRVWTRWLERPEAEAVAVAGERVLAVGTSREIQSLAGRATRVIDLAGARAVPGFHDSHVHFMPGGFLLGQVNLRDAADETEFGRRLREHASRLAQGQWVLGGNWDENRSLGGRLPDRAMLDRFVPDRPVCVRRYDGHIAACNSRALELAGLGAGTVQPADGVVDRDASGRPTGIVREGAVRLVLEKVPPPGEADVRQAIESALAEARRFGVTAVDEFGGMRLEGIHLAVRAYRRLAAEGRMSVRVNVFLPLTSATVEEAREVAAGFDGCRLRLGGFKAYYDGSLGARTALMFEPYLDAPHTCGMRLMPPDVLEELSVRADGADLPLAVHAIGDRAVCEVLDVFQAVSRRSGPRPERRLRIEHAQHIQPQDLPRFAELGVLASVQPSHAVDDARFAERCLGSRRLGGAFAWRSLLDLGASLAFGSDWPVAPLNPLLGIDAAVNRRPAGGEFPGGWFPEQRITVEEALFAYTAGSAHAARSEGGVLAPGGPADLAVLSRDILDPCQRDDIADTKVTMTVAAGKVWQF